MSTTTILRAKAPLPFRVDGSALLPVALAALPLAEIERLTLPAGNDVYPLGELFEVVREDGAATAGLGGADGLGGAGGLGGAASAGGGGSLGDTASFGDTAGAPARAAAESGPTLVIEGAGERLDRVGARMAAGRLVVRGGVGAQAGLRMSGGTLTIEGDAGGFAGCEMRGGRLEIHGSCGDFAAGALPGDMEGMTGGTLTIRGHAGARLADRMRRGLVLVGGDAGPFAAARLVAGTVGIAGTPGPHYAYGMRRGTLLLAREPAALPPTFSAGGRGFEVFWALLARRLAGELEPFSQWRAPPRARLTGDLAVDGRGEILIAG